MGGSVALCGRNIAKSDGHKALHYYFQSDPPCSLAGGTLKDENAVRGEPVEPWTALRQAQGERVEAGIFVAIRLEKL